MTGTQTVPTPTDELNAAAMIVQNATRTLGGEAAWHLSALLRRAGREVRDTGIDEGSWTYRSVQLARSLNAGHLTS